MAWLADLDRSSRPPAYIMARYLQTKPEPEAAPLQAWSKIPTKPAATFGQVPERPEEKTQPLTKSRPIQGGILAYHYTPKNWRRYKKIQGIKGIYADAYFDPAHEWDRARRALDQLLQEMAWGETEGRQYFVIQAEHAAVRRAVKALNKRRTRGGAHRWIAGGGLDIDTGQDTGQAILIYSSAGGPLEGHDSQVLQPDLAALYQLCLDLIRQPVGRNLAPHRGEKYAWGYQLNATRASDQKNEDEESEEEEEEQTGEEDQPQWEIVSSAPFSKIVELAAASGAATKRLKGRAWAIELDLDRYLRLHLANKIPFSLSRGDDLIIATIERIRAEHEAMSRNSPIEDKDTGEMRDITPQAPLFGPPKQPARAPAGVPE